MHRSAVSAVLAIANHWPQSGALGALYGNAKFAIFKRMKFIKPKAYQGVSLKSGSH